MLRSWEPEDAEWYVSARDEEVFRWTTEPRALTADNLRQVIERVRLQPTFAGFAIADPATGALLGNIALTVVDGDAGVAEVMYWLAPHARHRGAASDGVRTITDWAFQALPVRRIELLTHPGNRASQAVAVRTGFVPQGTRKNRLGKNRLVFTLSRRGGDD